jgi:hypothetical protein
MIVLTLWDVFEVVVLPRRVQRPLRPTRYFFRTLWRLWITPVARVRDGSLRESLLGVFGPLSVLLLIAFWAALLIVSYAMVFWGIGGPHDGTSFWTDLYFSGTTFFTLGLGDVSPEDGAIRAVTVLTTANGFAFLALVIGYLPTFYQSFSRRETNIALLDARAGSPPTAGELFRRTSGDGASDALRSFLVDSERWAAELLESHLSYPVLMLFRSQHEHQSWVAALTAILDVSAVIMCYGTETYAYQARLTFAMARHAAVDLSAVIETSPVQQQAGDRLSDGDIEQLEQLLFSKKGIEASARWREELTLLRAKYEPYVTSLSRYLLMPLPPWVAAPDALDAWQTGRYEGQVHVR